jgi:hypothetical protein
MKTGIYWSMRRFKNFIYFLFWDFSIDGAIRLTRFYAAEYINEWQYNRLCKWHFGK